MIDYPNWQKKKVGCIRIDGNVSAASRLALVTEFQEKESIKAAVVLINRYIYFPFLVSVT